MAAFIYLWSGFVPESQALLAHFQRVPECHSLCIDNPDIRSRMSKSSRVKVEKVPCLLIQAEGKLRQYEGPQVVEILRQLLTPQPQGNVPQHAQQQTQYAPQQPQYVQQQPQYTQQQPQYAQQQQYAPQHAQQQDAETIMVDPSSGIQFKMTGRSQPVDDEPGSVTQAAPSQQPQYVQPQQPQYVQPQQPQYVQQHAQQSQYAPQVGRTSVAEIPAESGAVSQPIYQPQPDQASQHYQTFARPPPPISYPSPGVSDKSQAYQTILSAAQYEQQQNPQRDIPM